MKRFLFILSILVMIWASACSSKGGNTGSSSTSNSAPQMSAGAGTAEARDSSAYEGGVWDDGNYANELYARNEYAGEAEKPAMSTDSLRGETDVAYPEESAGGISHAAVKEVRPEKIIQTANIEAQSERFDESMEALRAVAPEHGGFVESAHLYSQYNYARNTNHRVFTITLRVPTEQFEEVRRYVEGLAQVLSASQNAENVTAQYYDIVSRLETKLIEEERVLEMIGRATKIDDLLALEERLGIIRTQIAQYQSQITDIDRLAAYSTLYVTLYEVSHEDLIIVSDNLGGRIGKAFTSSVNRTVAFFQEVLIFLAGALIPLTILGLLAFIAVRVALAARRKQNEKIKKEHHDHEKM